MPRPGNTTARGYGHHHQRLRRTWTPTVATGRVICPRCDQRIRRGQDWDLDHQDDRAGYLGPAHAECNRRAGGAKAHQQHTDPDPRPMTRW